MLLVHLILDKEALVEDPHLLLLHAPLSILLLIDGWMDGPLMDHLAEGG